MNRVTNRMGIPELALNVKNTDDKSVDQTYLWHIMLTDFQANPQETITSTRLYNKMHIQENEHENVCTITH